MRIALVLVAAVLVSACGLNPETRRDAEVVPPRISAKNAEIAQKETTYRTFAESSEYAQYRVYAEREAWDKSFALARAKTSAAQAAFDRNVTPLLTRNRSDDDQNVQLHVRNIYTLVGEADRLAAVPMRRQGYITDLRARYRERFKEAEGNVGRAKALTAELSSRSRVAKSDFPVRVADIDKRLTTLVGFETAANVAFAKVSAETANANGGKFADLVVLDDNARLVSDNTSKMSESAKDLATQLSWLSRSYSKTLADMKVAYLITVERWSWDEDAEHPSVHHYAYPAQAISGEQFDYFNALPPSLPYVVRQTSGFWGRTAFADGVDPARWNALDIPLRKEWPSSSDDTAELGYALSGEYFHKYLVTENDVATETDWQRVDETTFEEHVDDLGMDIVSKPYGTFEDQKVAAPTPAGLAFVGNPRYGEWRTDDRGTSFWMWYGAYRMFGDLFGVRGSPYYYRRDEWDAWSTRYRGQPYYGEDKDRKERYGTGGYVTGSSNRYANGIPEMRKVTARHSGPIGRGTSFSGGK